MNLIVRLDERGRVTIPSEVRKSLGIDKDAELILEVRGSRIVLTKKLSPEEFIAEAHILQGEIEASKTGEMESLKPREIWRGKPED
ncbi:MAG: AbrB/MazE/SpoVT family DNA-binding domain-containing protein [Candidatus Geothermarchaeales archaeon]